jgi:hypothetical protein
MQVEASIERTPHARWPTALALALTAGVYLYLAFGYLPPGVYWSPDIGYKRIQAENVRFTPWLDVSIDYPGQRLDPDFRFVPFRHTFYYVWQGRIHFAPPPIVAVLARPFVSLMGDAGERVVPMLAGLVCAWLAARLMKTHGIQPEWAGALLAGLATPMLIYSLFLWEHILGVALGLGALALAFDLSGARPRWQWVLGGLLVGLAASVRKELMLFAPLAGMTLALRTFRSPGRNRVLHLALWAGACLIAPGVYLAHAYLHSGQIVPPELRISVRPEFTPQAYFLRLGPRALADFVFDPQFGWLGDLLLIAASAYWLATLGPRTRLREAIQVGALAALGIGVWNAAQRLGPAGGLIGLLSACPFFVLGLEGDGRARGLRRIALGFYALVVINLGLFTPAGPYQTGLEWGTRFALIVFPLGAPLAVNGLRAVWERAKASRLARAHLTLALLLIGLSVFIQLLGLSRFRAPAVRAEGRDALLALPEPQVLTNLWWLTAAAPRLYLAKEVFFVNSEADLRDWLSIAHAHGVREFAFVGYVPLTQTSASAAAPAGTSAAVLETRTLANQMIVTRVRLDPAP